MKCVNIDWLEVFCLEDPIGYPHDANYFRKCGWQIEEREYGTPVYHEMFTLIDHFGEKYLEIRRKPKSDKKTLHGLFDPYSCHVRLCNRTCYFTECAAILSRFLELHGLHFQRISRLDLCLDFERFDFGDYPNEFIKRYFKGKFSKINQANINAHGADSWAERTWNSVSWGSKNSMVVTRFYCKSEELAQVKDKPYIRQAWKVCGLIDDVDNMTKISPKGKAYKPSIWRVEFQIKSGTKKWFVIEDYNGDRKRLQSIHHTLDDYFTRAQLLDRFYSLAHHYFHFKHFVKNKRKNLCKDKKLFDYTQINNFYSIESVATAKPKNNVLESLLLKLLTYRDTHLRPDIFKACNVLIESIETERARNNLTIPWNMDEVEALRLVIAKRLKDHSRPLSVDMEEAKQFVQIQKTLWQDT